MIEFEVVDYLLTDSSFKTLIGYVSVDEPKIYPQQAKLGAVTPYVLYYWGVGGTLSEVLEEDRIQFNCISTDLNEARQIRDRIEILLNKQDEIQQTTLYSASSTYFIYNSKMSGGDYGYEEITSKHIVIIIFNIKYRKNTF